MYSTLDSGKISDASGLRRLARRDLPSTPRVPPRAAVQPVSAPAPFGGTWPELSVVATLGWLFSRFRWIVILVALGVAAGAGYTMLAKPKYTAYADLIIDPANLQVMTNDVYQRAFDQNAQLLAVESRLRVLTSGNVLRRVATELHLAADPEFQPAPGFPLFGLGGRPTPADPVLDAVGLLESKVGAWREERSFVVTLSVSSESADKAARIAAAIVEAFKAELAQGDAEGASRAAGALMDRLAELKTGVTAAEDAVASFRRVHGLQESQGELVSSGALAQLNTQVADARQALIAAEARYAELTDPTSGRVNADAVDTATMVQLRTQYSILKQQTDAAATTYGPLHPARATTERQLAGLAQQIADETQRAVQAARLAVKQARGTLAQLQVQAQAARVTVATDGEALVQLRDLERDAKAKSDIYEAFLARAGEVNERERIDTTNVRIISPPTPPGARSWPPKVMVGAGLGGFAGGALGIALALGLGFLAETKRLRT